MKSLTHPQSLNGVVVEIWEWISDFKAHFTGLVLQEIACASNQYEIV